MWLRPSMSESDIGNENDGLVLGQDDEFPFDAEGARHDLGLAVDVLEVQDDIGDGFLVLLRLGLVLRILLGEELLEAVLVEFGLARLEEELVEVGLAGEFGEAVPGPVGEEEERFSVLRPFGAALVIGGVGQGGRLPRGDLDGEEIQVRVAPGRDGDDICCPATSGNRRRTGRRSRPGRGGGRPVRPAG